MGGRRATSRTNNSTTNLLSKAKVTRQNYYEENGIKYVEDKHNVVFEHSQNNVDNAYKLSEFLGEKVILIPRVNNPSGIQTPDYLVKNERWDNKKVNGASSSAFYTRARTKRKQADNFIFDITESKIKMKGAQQQVANLRRQLKWVKRIIVIKGKCIVEI